MTEPRDAAAKREAITASVGSTHLRLIEGGAERLHALLALIRGARSSLRLLFYIFADDRCGRAVRDALVEAAGRGVRVRILLDGFGCGGLDPRFFAGLESGGGQFCLFHPKVGRRYLLRNHQKLAIADEGVALIGGSNIQDEYLEDDGPRHWRDLMLRVEGGATPAAARYFDALYRWSTDRRSTLRRLRRIVHEHSQFRGPVQWKFTAPLAVRNPWRTGVARDISASRLVDVIAAYFSPPRSMLRRLGRRAGSGRVRVITAATSDNQATVAAARHTYARLLRRGVEMWEYRAARLHTKLVVADDVIYLGSANFDFRSFYLNLEIMLRVRDAGFAEAMRGYFERELASSEHITPELHRKRATLLRRLRWTLSHFLVTMVDYTVARRLNFRPDA
jgi:cardiolipin synthase A/B